MNLGKLFCTYAASVAICGLSTIPALSADLTERVQTTSGAVTGLVNDGVSIFKGIPYGASTAGDARWMPPGPAPIWNGVRAGDALGPICPQINSFGMIPSDVEMSEDCLNLNIWTPSVSGEKKAVMVWIHGGAFRFGYGGQESYDGSKLAGKDVIVVAPNYRLDRLGIFAHPALSRLNQGQPLANYYMMDLVAALEWVRDNIEAFGGDPNNVTIFGQSAGGVAVNYLMAMPSAKGLFHKAISQSGGVRIVGGRHVSKSADFEQALEKEGEAFVRWLGLEAAGDEDMVATMRAVPIDKILEFSGTQQANSLNPVVDGILIPEPIGTVFAEGRQHPVPYLAGATDWEESLIARFTLPLAQILRDTDPEEARTAYPGADDKALGNQWFRDWSFLAPAEFLVREVARADAPAYLYNFSYVSEARTGMMPGVPHGGDVAYVFGNFIPFAGLTYAESDAGRAEIVQAYWVAFAKTGNPNSERLPNWPAYAPNDPALLEIGANIEADPGRFADSVDFHLKRFDDQLDLAN